MLPPLIPASSRMVLTFLFHRLVTEWRIQKRVDEQFQAFIQGFHELVPADLVNVFDERELELLIGGISEIDVDDWIKNTDYRGYDEKDPVIQNFWKVSLNHIPINTLDTIADIVTHSVSVLGILSRNHVSCSSLRVHRVSRSTASKISKARTARVVSPLRSLVRKHSCPSLTLASTGWIYPLTRHMKPSTGS